ncbi:AfsR/SARP family transcriptional regulator [Streptomyces sp. NPDC088785]|uniref:AfsR/SARP family transcriptional regulator n=1 Tax=Streptomyces sp. NPDC088785 TaxID=3365897 RepID=UPI0037F5110C
MRYTILGTTTAYDDAGTPVQVGGPRLRALLTSLALHTPRPAPTPALIDDVWGDAPPADAPAALQALVGRLRRALGKDAVTSEPGGYRLAATRDDIDLYVFDRLARDGAAALAAHAPESAARTLRAALALWRGPALADLPGHPAATRPEAQRLETTRARAQADLELGRAAGLVPELRELTAAHPYDEPLHALLIRALAAAGRRADALAAHETARRVLADGLGTDPGPELSRLHAALLTQPAASGTPSGLGAASVPGAPSGPGAPSVAGTASVPGAPSGPGTPSAPGASAVAGTSSDPGAPSDPGTPSAPGAPPAPDAISAPRPPARTGNLRPRLNSFVGREPELDAIRAEVRGARLVTLTGPGGSGKTRLAEEAAAPEPQAWLVELAPLDDPKAVPGAVVSALGLRETVLRTAESSGLHDDPVRLLVEYCAHRELLLILDNCEHVIDAAAGLAETLLTHCPGLTILATSREPLGVPGESVRPVEPLPPDPAHRLFAERAAAVRPGFDPARDAAAVAEICRRLDGLPLAIELAAARLRMLTPRQIADRLDDRFRLLTGGSRTVLPRQQTLRAVVDWSWDLLDDAERTALCELSVFAGGWTLEAAEAVCSPSGGADAVGSLVDKSLLVASPADRGLPGMRYRMLETIHEYAAERAAAMPELRLAAERRHLGHVRALAAAADPELRAAGQLPWIQRMEAELDNVRAALTRVTSTPGVVDEEAAIDLALHMGWFWWLRNYRPEGSGWVRTIRDMLPDAIEPDATEPDAPAPDDTAPDDTADPLYWPRMKLRLLALFLVTESTPQEVIRSEADRAYMMRVRAAFEPPSPQGATFPGIIWPFTLFVLDGMGDVREALDRAVAHCRRFGGDWEVGVTLMFRTHMVVDMAGQMAGVDDDLVELREISRRVGDRWMRAQVCSAAAEVAMGRGSHREARGEFEEALRLAYEVGAYAETPFLMARIAEISYREGDREAARTALGAAGEEADRYGVADSTAFIGVLNAHLALADGDVARARELCEESRAIAEDGTPPPQFHASLGLIDARVTAAEAGPEPALALLTDTLREALAGHCSEIVLAGLLDVGAELHARLDDVARAVRLFAAADGLRCDRPRPQPERDECAAVDARARAGLGDTRYAAERAAGTALTPDRLAAELSGT